MSLVHIFFTYFPAVSKSDQLSSVKFLNSFQRFHVLYIKRGSSLFLILRYWQSKCLPPKVNLASGPQVSEPEPALISSKVFFFPLYYHNGPVSIIHSCCRLKAGKPNLTYRRYMKRLCFFGVQYHPLSEKGLALGLKEKCHTFFFSILS